MLAVTVQTVLLLSLLYLREKSKSGTKVEQLDHGLQSPLTGAKSFPFLSACSYVYYGVVLLLSVLFYVHCSVLSHSVSQSRSTEVFVRRGCLGRTKFHQL